MIKNEKIVSVLKQLTFRELKELRYDYSDIIRTTMKVKHSELVDSTNFRYKSVTHSIDINEINASEVFPCDFLFSSIASLQYHDALMDGEIVLHIFCVPMGDEVLNRLINRNIPSFKRTELETAISFVKRCVGQRFFDFKYPETADIDIFTSQVLDVIHMVCGDWVKPMHINVDNERDCIVPFSDVYAFCDEGKLQFTFDKEDEHKKVHLLSDVTI